MPCDPYVFYPKPMKSRVVEETSRYQNRISLLESQLARLQVREKVQ